MVFGRYYGETTNGLLYDALTIVTKRVRDQVKEGGRPFQGADVTVDLWYLADPGLLRIFVCAM